MGTGALSLSLSLFPLSFLSPLHHLILFLLQLAVDQVVMVNFNPDHPRSRGYWYDGLVTRKVNITVKHVLTKFLYPITESFSYTQVNDGKKLYCKLILR